MRRINPRRIISIIILIVFIIILIITQKSTQFINCDYERNFSLEIEQDKVTKAIVVTPAPFPTPVPTEEPEEKIDELEDIEEESITNEVVQDQIIEETSPSSYTYYGNCRITFYCPCAQCNGGYTGTASGEPLTPWITAANGDLPFGTWIEIDGLGRFCVQDRGVGSGQIDVCVSTHEEALQLGLFYRDVYIIQ